MATLKKFVPPVEFHPGIHPFRETERDRDERKGVCCTHLKTGKDKFCRHQRQKQCHL